MKTGLKIAIALLVISIILNYIEARQIVPLKDNFKAPHIILNDKAVCIWDQSLRKIYVYTPGKFDKIAVCGGHGVGPGEFIGIDKVSISNNIIYVSSFPKISFFTIEGRLIKEIKTESKDAGGFVPIGKNYAGESYPFTNPSEEKIKLFFCLFDANFKERKDIFKAELKRGKQVKGQKNGILRFSDCVRAVVCNNKLFIGDTGKGFYIGIFDMNGDKLLEINRKYEKRKVSNEDKKFDKISLIQSWGDEGWKKFEATHEIIYPEYYPAYMNFAVSNDKIYVFFHRKQDNQEVFIFDAKGNLLGKRIINLIEPWILETKRFSVYNGRLYYVIDNDDTGQWELHIEQID